MPTNPELFAWPKIRRLSGLVERVCPHGVGHPDPYSLETMEGDGWGVHGCDGCCVVEARWTLRDNVVRDARAAE